VEFNNHLAVRLQRLSAQEHIFIPSHDGGFLVAVESNTVTPVPGIVSSQHNPLAADGARVVTALKAPTTKTATKRTKIDYAQHVNFFTMEIAVTRSCVRNHFGETKTEASRKPVPLHKSVCDVLAEWRAESLYTSDSDFLFPSLRMNGTQPLMPDMVLKKAIRPALVRAGITGKVIGWHSFRHSWATNLRSLGVDVKVAQELLRHANSRTTMDLYTQAVSEDKRNASLKQVEMLLA